MKKIVVILLLVSSASALAQSYSTLIQAGSVMHINEQIELVNRNSSAGDAEYRGTSVGLTTCSLLTHAPANTAYRIAKNAVLSLRQIYSTGLIFNNERDPKLDIHVSCYHRDRGSVRPTKELIESTLPVSITVPEMQVIDIN